jgi:hypothetical protein
MLQTSLDLNEHQFPSTIEQEKSKTQLFESLKLQSGNVSADELMALINEACILLYFQKSRVSVQLLSKSCNNSRGKKSICSSSSLCSPLTLKMYLLFSLGR